MLRLESSSDTTVNPLFFDLYTSTDKYTIDLMQLPQRQADPFILPKARMKS